MIVFKFGGASVRSAKAVQNVANVLKRYPDDQIAIVVSAMGKTTNAMEVIADHFFHKRKSELKKAVEERKNYHREIVDELFPEKDHPFHAEFSNVFEELESRLGKEPTLHYDFDYDQIVPYGELISTKIISAYLNESGVENRWMDIRKYLKSNNAFREARIDWDLSSQLVPKGFHFRDTRVYITQGFVASTIDDITTTLGREGFGLYGRHPGPYTQSGSCNHLEGCSRRAQCRSKMVR